MDFGVMLVVDSEDILNIESTPKSFLSRKDPGIAKILYE